MKFIKDISAIVGLLVIILVIADRADSKYATQLNQNIQDAMIIENKDAIQNHNVSYKKIGAILCGIVIDLNLPSARKECDTIITITN